MQTAGGPTFIRGEGQAHNGVLLVSESPGEHPFFLDRVLRRAGLLRSQFGIAHVVSCRPPGYPPAEAIVQCAGNLEQTIREQAPKCIVALGNTALRRLVADADHVARYRGFVLAGQNGGWVIPTYPPTYLVPRDGQNNTSRLVGVVLRDIRRAVHVAQHGFRRTPTDYLKDPNEGEFASWVAEFENAWARPNGGVRYLAFDIETAYKLKAKDDDELPEDEAPVDDGPPVGDPILRISFSYRVGKAVTVPWRGEYLSLITRLLTHPAAKATWNGVRFDVPVIESHGYHVNGRIYDFMWAFHVWQSDLPKSLEFACSLLTDLEPWKHKSESEPALYSAIDADAQLRCAYELERELTASGQWDIFERHVTDLDPLLMAMGKRGVLIDRVAQNELRAELEAERDTLLAEAQTVVPDELKPRTEYKRPPTEPGNYRFEIRWIPGTVKRCSHCYEIATNKTEHFKGGKKNNPCKAAGATINVISEPISVWDRVEDFNPNSVQHLLAYANHFEHEVPIHYKTKQQTFDKKVLERFSKHYSQKKHPIYPIALKLRGVKKTLGTYVEGFRPDAEGLIHTTFGHHPSSLRLSSRNVNLQNVSHRNGVAYASRVRRTLIPRPGHVFVEADSSAVEAVMTGYFMGSAEYIALAKRGIHDYLTCLELNLAFIPEMVSEWKQRPEYDVARTRNKIVVHGTSYGMTPYLMHMNWPDVFPHVADAIIAQQRFFDACPGLPTWQHDVRTFAHKNGYLENPWKYRHYFYDVFTKDRDGKVILGSDGNRCVSFLPQSSNAAFSKDNILLLSQTRWWPMPAIGVVHDSYCLEVPEADVADATDTLMRILTRPIPEMNGLTVGCEVKVSVPDQGGVRHWDSMQVVRKAA